MSFTLGKASRSMLVGVHPRLVRVVERAIILTTQDFSVKDGLRTAAQAKAYALQGSGIESSLHLRQADGFSHAVDLIPYPFRNWEDLAGFRRIASGMFAAADELEVLLQWGADWDTDGRAGEKGEWDYPHFQLPNLPQRKIDAAAARKRRIAERLRSPGALVI